MKNKQEHVWVVSGHSESGDDYGPKRYDHKPAKKDLKDFIKKETPEEVDCDGPGDFGSYVYLTIHKL
jgi:hypothetical protein